MSFGLRSVALVVLFAFAGCGGGSDDDPVQPPPVAAFMASGTAAMADGVRLVESARTGNTLELSVVLGGQTQTGDLYGFAFDLEIGNTAVLAFSGDAPVLGDALDPAGCAGVEALANQSGNRVVVGITKLGACPGNGVGPGESVVATLRFRVRARGTSTLTFAGAPSAFDSLQDPISSIQFDAVSATVSGV